MKERPIIFSAPMVRAILSGTKTQTRRIIKPQPTPCIGGRINWCDKGRSFTGSPENFSRCCPFGQPGDRMWVRETWKHIEGGVIYDASGGVMDSFDHEIIYRADRPNHLYGPWRSPIHMPRWASRITLEITDVRVERLQDISEADAIAEGCRPVRPEIVLDGLVARTGRSAVDEYRQLWQSIHGPESWSANPWVWAIEFKRLEKA